MINKLTEDVALKFKTLSPEEKKSKGILGRLYGPVASFAAPTRNGRRYSEQLWEKLFNSDLIKERFANGGIMGELCHPEDREEVAIDRVACIMPEPPVRDKDGQLIAYIDLIDSPCGKIAYQLAKYGYKLGISSRGSGDLITGPDGEEEVDPDTYSLTAFDLVEIPAVQSARLSFVESLDTKRYGKTLRQTLTESLKKASDSDRKLMEESLDSLGINLNEELNESAAQELAGYFKEWQEANPDIELDLLIHEYNGNLGSIMYNEADYDKFVKWAKDEHAITINPISSNDSDFSDEDISLEEPEEDISLEEPEAEISLEEPGEEQLEEFETSGTQLADIGQIPQSSEGELLVEDEYTKDELVDKFGTDDLDIINAGREEDVKLNDDSFYINETPYGFTEIVYKGRVITVDGDQITVNIDGDEAVEDSLDSAVATIEELDADPEYHVDHWHDPSDLQLASLDAVKETLGLKESMYVKGKKVAESAGREKAVEESEPIDEDLIKALDEELSNNDDKDYFERQIEKLTDEMLNLAMEARESGADRLSDLMQRLMNIIEGEQDRIDESDEIGSDTDVDIVESDEPVAELKEALKKAKNLNKDNLSLQEKLSASNARETKLEEELEHYKKATISLSKSAKESKSLKESLAEKDKESAELVEKLTATASKVAKGLKNLTEAKQENKKLTEQLEQLKTKEAEVSKQLDASKELVEKYRKSYTALKESYVAAKAQAYGLSKDAALQYLGESYKVSDVDKTLRNLGATKKNFEKLPIDLNESVKINKAGLSIKSNERINSLDDTSLDVLKSLLD